MADEDVNPTDNPEFRRIARDYHLAGDDLGVALKNASIWERSAVNVVGHLVAYFGRSASKILDFVGLLIEQLEDKSSLIFTPLMARLVGHALGADVSGDAIHERLDRAGTSAIGNVTAQTVFDMLAPPAGELAPGDTGAKRMVGALGHMTVNNWAEGLILEYIAEFFSLSVDLKALPELAQQLINNMGLNRLARTALRPLAHTVVALPLEWKLNKQYRPTMLNVGDAIAAMLAGELEEETMREIATRKGFGDDAIAIMISQARKRFSASDLDLLVRMGLKDRDWAIAQLRAGGLETQEAEDRLVLEDAKSLRTYQLAAAARAVDAYADRRLDDVTLADELDHLGLDQVTLDRYHADAARRRRLNVQLLRRGDVEAAVKNEILGIADYADWLEGNGYGHEAAITLQLTLMADMQKLEDARAARSRAAADREAAKAAKQQEQQATRDRVAAEHAHWTGTLGEAERLVVRNIMPANQYRQVLIDHGLSAGDADALTAVATQDRDDRAAAAQKRLEAAAKSKTPIVSLALLERGVLLGKRSIDDFRAELARRHYVDGDVALLVGLVQQDLADRAAAQAKRDAAAAALQLRNISLGQLEAAVLAGERTIDDYRQLLTREKYSGADVATLVALLEQKVNDRALAETRHALAEQKLEASRLSLAQEEAAVVDGIVTFDDYTLYLEAHGFDVDDQAILRQLLFEKWQKKNGAA